MVDIFSVTPAIPEGKSVETINPYKIPLPEGFKITKIHFSRLRSGSWAAGHKHSRREIFFSYSPISLIWLDDSGHKRNEIMGVNPDGSLRIYIIGSGTPHFLINNSSSDQFYVELADGPLESVVSLDFGQNNEVV